MHQREIRRQVFHLLYGPLIILLFQYHLIDIGFLFGVIIGGIFVSYLIKKEYLSHVAWVLSFFERDHHMKQFPGRGILFFTLGAFLCLILFEAHIAYAGILILSVGDAVTNVIGRHYGRIQTVLNPHKYLEGTFAGIILSIPIAYFFVPNLLAAISASCLAMFLEIPNIKIFGFEIDDNIIIPVVASFTLHLFA